MLGRVMREQRIRLGLSREDLARSAGVDVKTIGNIETGRTRPRPSTVSRLANALRLDDDQRRRIHDLTAASGDDVPTGNGSGVPAQLPADVTAFVGRVDHLARLDAFLAESSDPHSTTVVITAIAGTGGIGKTALAVTWAHRVAHGFPDGQLFVDLHGFGPGPPTRPVDALAGFLRALGAAGGETPIELEEAAALYRSRLANRRMLIVLDNAASAEQVRPLLPGAGGCFVVITSRDRLGGLVVTDGARSLPLDVLTEKEALDLLRRSLGEQVVDAQAQAATQLTRICGCLPLALRIAAAHLTGSPQPSIQEYLHELAAAGPVEALSIAEDPDVAVRATFDTSYARLSPAQQRVFRMLGLAPGADVSVAAVAVLTGTAEVVARRLLDQLAAVHLVTQPRVGRYGLHDLLRGYAEQRTRTEDPPAERTSAVERLLSWYLYRAWAANELLYPYMIRLDLPPSPDLPPVGFDDSGLATQWLAAERANLLAAIHHAAQYGPPRMACMLLDTMRGYLWGSRQVVDWWEAVQAGVAVAERDGDPRLRAAMLISLGAVHSCLQQPQAAIEACARAKQLAAEAGWLLGEAVAANNLTSIYDDIGQIDLALQYNQEALELYTRAEYALGVRTVHTNRAFLLHLAGRLHEAEDQLKELTEQQPTVVAPTLEAHVWHYRGVISSDLGNLATARTYLTRALALTSQANRLAEAYVRRDLAILEFDVGHADRARLPTEEALQLARDVGDRRIESRMLSQLGSILCAEAEPQRGLDLHHQALSLARSIRNARDEAEALLGLARAYSAVGDHPAAIATATDATRLAQDGGLRLVYHRALTTLARITLRANDPKHAAEYLEQALAGHRQTGQRLGEARALAVLAELAHHRRDSAAAEEYAVQARRICLECGADPRTL